MLSANDGKIINTSANKSLIKVSLRVESGVSGPEAARTTAIPKIPKTTEAQINTRVAIFCITLSIRFISLNFAPATGIIYIEIKRRESGVNCSVVPS